MISNGALSIHRFICKDSIVIVWVFNGKLVEHLTVLRSWN